MVRKTVLSVRTERVASMSKQTVPSRKSLVVNHPIAYPA